MKSRNYYFFFSLVVGDVFVFISFDWVDRISFVDFSDCSSLVSLSLVSDSGSVRIFALLLVVSCHLCDYRLHFVDSLYFLLKKINYFMD